MLKSFKRKTFMLSMVYAFALVLMFGISSASANGQLTMKSIIGNQSSTGFDQTLLTQDISVSNNNFESFRVDYTGMSIFDNIDQPVIRNGKQVTTTESSWIDPLYQYPTIAVSWSQPFLTDPTFNEIPEDEKSDYLSRYDATNKIQVSDTNSGKVYYLKQYNLAFDTGIQTYANFNPFKQYYNIYVSPLDSLYHAHAGRTDWDAFDLGGGTSRLNEPYTYISAFQQSVNGGEFDINTRDGWEYLPNGIPSEAFRTLKGYPAALPVGFKENDIEPKGILGAICDTGTANTWTVTYANPSAPAVLQASLEPIGDNRWGGNNWEYFGSSSFTDPSASTQVLTPVKPDLTQVRTNLATNYGNRMTIARPVFKVTALTEFLSGFDYTIEKMINGKNVKINVKTTSAKIGIYRALDAGSSFSLYGYVKNSYNAADLESKYHNIVPEPVASSPLGTASNPIDFIPTPTSAFSHTVGGTMRLSPTQPQIIEPLTGGATAFSPINDLPFVASISVSTFSQILPTVFNTTMKYKVAPFTTVEWAKYNVDGNYLYYDGANLLDLIFTEDKEGEYSTIVEYPFKLNLDNVFATRRMGYRVAVLTENSADIVIANGRPIKVTDFNEFNLNSLGRLVDNYVSGNLTSSEFDWTSLFGTPLTLILIIGIGVIIVFVVILSSRGGGRTKVVVQGAGTAPMPSQWYKTPTGKIVIYIMIGLVSALVITMLIVGFGIV